MYKNNISRREIRECAFIILFERAFQKNTEIEELYSVVEDLDLPFSDDVKELVEGVIEHEDEINSIIAKYSIKRSFDRIAALNKVILQLAVFDILYQDKTAVNAAIKEAVHLAEIYTYKDDVSYINGVLGSYSKSLEKEDASNE